MDPIQQFRAIRLIIQSPYKQNTYNWITESKGSITDWMRIAFPERGKTDNEARKFILNLRDLDIFIRCNTIRKNGKDVQLYQVTKEKIKILQKIAHAHPVKKEVELLYDVGNSFWKKSTLDPILLD